jgi:hypothetical protein
MKTLGKSTNIVSVANPSQIQRKMRDSVSQNRSKVYNRDLNDLKVVYDIRQTRLRSASAASALGKRSTTSIYNSRFVPT